MAQVRRRRAWVADIDFGVAPPISEALARLARSQEYGYAAQAPNEESVMRDTQKTETDSRWVNLARQTDREGAQERAQAAQDRAERMRARADEQPAEPAQRRRKGLRP
jgi:hypothetical protein